MEDYDVIVVGAGPAGIFTALELDKLAPEKRILVIDSGSAIEHRSCPARTTGTCRHCATCSIMNGWAGAGAFSDGKLSLSEEYYGLYICRGSTKADPLCRWDLPTFWRPG